MDEETKYKTDPNEGSILSAILNDAEGNELLDLTSKLTPEDFLDLRNRTIFSTLLEMSKHNIPPSVESLKSTLNDLKKLEEIGGEGYINFLADDCYAPVGMDSFVNAVKDHSLLNQFLNALKDIQNQAIAGAIPDISDFIGLSEEKITKITQQRRVAEVKRLDAVNSELVNQLVIQTEENRKNGKRPDGVTGLGTGYKALDSITKGWHKGDMIIVGARPSVGKTAFALNLLYNVAKKGTPVVFFSLEMSATSIAMRLLELTAGLSSDEINSLEFEKGSTRDQVLINDEHDPIKAGNAAKLRQGLLELNALPFYIDDNPGSKVMDIIAKAKKLRNLIPNLGLMAIDYIGLITAQTKSSDSRQNEVASISRQIKQLARDINVPIIALSQLSRDTEKREDHTPQMSDIRESGAIEQDADMIIFLYRKDYYGKGEDGKDKESSGQPEEESPISTVNVDLKKNRNGRIGDLVFSFDKEHCSFTLISSMQDDAGGPNTPF
ncbi:MAG: replicative DNA helicase [Bacilli bacterium]|jgi:replicative DNA helicase